MAIELELLYFRIGVNSSIVSTVMCPIPDSRCIIVAPIVSCYLSVSLHKQRRCSPTPDGGLVSHYQIGESEQNHWAGVSVALVLDSELLDAN